MKVRSSDYNLIVTDKDEQPGTKPSTGSRRIGDLSSIGRGNLKASSKVLAEVDGLAYLASKADLFTGVVYDDNIITVGVNGSFETCAEALAYIETQPQWVDVDSDNLGVPFLYTSISWDQGSRVIAAAPVAAAADHSQTTYPNFYWMRITGDTEPWHKIKATNGATFYTNTPREDASYSETGAGLPIEFRFPIFYKIVLLDYHRGVYTDSAAYVLTKPVNIIISSGWESSAYSDFVSVGNSEFNFQINVSQLSSADAYGTIIFEGLTFNSGIGPYLSGANDLYNRIDLFFNGCTVNYKSTDFESAQNWVGSLTVNGMLINMQPLLGGTHFWSMSTKGDVNIDRVKINYLQISGIGGHEWINSLTCDTFRLTNVEVQVESAMATVSHIFVLVGGLKGARYSHIDNITVMSISTTLPTELTFIVAEGYSSVSPANWDHLANSDIYISNVRFLGDWSQGVGQVYNTGDLPSGLTAGDSTVEIEDGYAPNQMEIDHAVDTLKMHGSARQVHDWGSSSGVLTVHAGVANVHKFTATGNTVILISNTTPGQRFYLEISDDGSARQPSISNGPGGDLKNGADFGFLASGGNEGLVVEFYTDSDNGTWILSQTNWNG